MAVETYTPSIAEVLKKVNNAKTKDKKIEILRKHDTESLRGDATDYSKRGTSWYRAYTFKIRGKKIV